MNLLPLLLMQNALQLPLYSFSSPIETFPEYRGMRSKKHFLDHRTTNTIELVVAIKIFFSGLFFF